MVGFYDRAYLSEVVGTIMEVQVTSPKPNGQREKNKDFLGPLWLLSTGLPGDVQLFCDSI